MRKWSGANRIVSAAKMTVVGIDVGGERKGFYAVALQNGPFSLRLYTVIRR